MVFHKVFVYGTLKRGEPNHGKFAEDASASFRFVGKAKTAEKYPLIIWTKYNIPFLLYHPGLGHRVEGELYEVDDAVFKILDLLEDHPNFYIREQRAVLLEGNKETAWIYFIKDFKPDLLKETFYESYSNSADHGLKYVEKYLRTDRNSDERQLFDLVRK